MPETFICLAPARWTGAWQRPRHLLMSCAHDHRVVCFEAPVAGASVPELALRSDGAVTIAVPHLPPAMSDVLAVVAQRRMIDRLLYELGEPRPVLWYCTPRALAFTHHVRASAVVYACVAEASRSARVLRANADLVLTEHAAARTWSEVWPPLERAILARRGAPAGRAEGAGAAVAVPLARKLDG